MKKKVLALLLITSLSVQAMDNKTVADNVNEYVQNIMDGGHPSITKQALMNLLSEKEGKAFEIDLTDIIELDSTVLAGKNRHYKLKFRNAFRDEMASLAKNPEFVVSQNQAQSLNNRAANTGFSKVSSWKKWFMSKFKTQPEIQQPNAPLHNVMPQEQYENPYDGLEGFVYSGIIKARQFKNWLASRVANAAGSVGHGARHFVQFTGSELSGGLNRINQWRRNVQNEAVDFIKDPRHSAVGNAIRNAGNNVADKLGARSATENGNVRDTVSSDPAAAQSVLENNITVVANENDILVQETEQPTTQENNVISQPEQQAEPTTQPEPAMQAEPTTPQVQQSQPTVINQEPVQAPSAQPQPVVQPSTSRETFFDKLAHHKWKLMAIGTLGTLIAGYKFFGTQAQQTKMLEDLMRETIKIAGKVKNGKKLKKLKLKAQDLSRLNKENQAALQKYIDAFNKALVIVKEDKRGLSVDAQAAVVLTIAKQLAETVIKCVEQIENEPVRTSGIFSMVADKFGSFCSAIKYYAWDKWVTRKKVSLS